MGAYSPNRLAIWDAAGAPAGSYAFFERDGSKLNLGFSPGPWTANEQTLLQLNFLGLNDPHNNIQVNTGRLQTGSSSNTDMTGELKLTSASSITYTLAGAYTIHPECTATPQFDIGSGNRMWLTYSGVASFTLNFANAVTGTVSYVCLGRN